VLIICLIVGFVAWGTVAYIGNPDLMVATMQQRAYGKLFGGIAMVGFPAGAILYLILRLFV
jgi:hypothetical protein